MSWYSVDAVASSITSTGSAIIEPLPHRVDATDGTTHDVGLGFEESQGLSSSDLSRSPSSVDVRADPPGSRPLELDPVRCGRVGRDGVSVHLVEERTSTRTTLT